VIVLFNRLDHQLRFIKHARQQGPIATVPGMTVRINTQPLCPSAICQTCLVPIELMPATHPERPDSPNAEPLWLDAQLPPKVAGEVSLDHLRNRDVRGSGRGTS
jgi:hypothetical protein